MTCTQSRAYNGLQVVTSSELDLASQRFHFQSVRSTVQSDRTWTALCEWLVNPDADVFQFEFFLFEIDFLQL
jgi:hypothetical protein